MTVLGRLNSTSETGQYDLFTDMSAEARTWSLSAAQGYMELGLMRRNVISFGAFSSTCR